MSNFVTFFSVDSLGKITMTSNDVNSQTNTTPASLGNINFAGNNTTISGTTTVPTPAPTTNDTTIATTEYVTYAVTDLVDGSNNWTNGINWKGKNTFNPDNTNNNVIINTSGIIISSINQDITVSGNMILSGPTISIPAFTTDGLLHSNSSGILSNSKLIDSDIINGTIQNNKFQSISQIPVPNSIVERDVNSYIYSATSNISDNSLKIATTKYVDTNINSIKNGADPSFDTLGELQNSLLDSSNVASNLINTTLTKMDDTVLNNELSTKTNISSISITKLPNSVVQRDSSSFIYLHTAPVGDDTDIIATTKFVTDTISPIKSDASNSLNKIKNMILNTSGVLSDTKNLTNTKADASSTNYLLSLNVNSSLVNDLPVANTLVQRNSSGYIYTETPSQTINSNVLATTAYVDKSIVDVIGNALPAYNTLGKLQTEIQSAGGQNIAQTPAVQNLITTTNLKMNASSFDYLNSLKVNTSNVSILSVPNTIVQRDSSSYIYSGTPAQGESSLKVATTSYVDNEFLLIKDYPNPEYDTLKKIQDILSNSTNITTNILNSISSKIDTSILDSLLEIKVDVSDVSAQPITSSVVQRDSSSYILVGTASQNDNSTKVATTGYMDSVKSGLIDNATTNFNTLGKLETELKNASGTLGFLTNLINLKANSSSVNYELSLKANASSVNNDLLSKALKINTLTTDSSQTITGVKEFTNNITLTGLDPTDANHLVTKDYVDKMNSGKSLMYQTMSQLGTQYIVKNTSGVEIVDNSFSTINTGTYGYGYYHHMALSYDGKYMLAASNNTVNIDDDTGSVPVEENVVLIKYGTNTNKTVPTGTGSIHAIKCVAMSIDGKYQLIYAHMDATTDVFGGNLLKSTDFGSSFVTINIKIENTTIVDFSGNIIPNGQTYNGVIINKTTFSTERGWTPPFDKCSISDDGKHILLSYNFFVSSSQYRGVYISNNGGQTYKQLITPHTNPSIASCMSRDGKYMYIAVSGSSNKQENGIFKSSDYGSTWTRPTLEDNHINWDITKPGSGTFSFSCLNCSADGRYVITAGNYNSTIKITMSNDYCNTTTNDFYSDKGNIGFLNADLYTNRNVNISPNGKCIFVGLSAGPSSSDNYRGIHLSTTPYPLINASGIIPNRRRFYEVANATKYQNSITIADSVWKNWSLYITSIQFTDKYVYICNNFNGTANAVGYTKLYRILYNPEGMDYFNNNSSFKNGTLTYNVAENKAEIYYNGAFY